MKSNSNISCYVQRAFSTMFSIESRSESEEEAVESEDVSFAMVTK